MICFDTIMIHQFDVVRMFLHEVEMRTNQVGMCERVLVAQEMARKQLYCYGFITGFWQDVLIREWVKKIYELRVSLLFYKKDSRVVQVEIGSLDLCLDTIQKYMQQLSVTLLKILNHTRLFLNAYFVNYILNHLAHTQTYQYG